MEETTEGMSGELMEQRHQLMDLDPDSQWTDYPGAKNVACPPVLVVV